MTNTISIRDGVAAAVEASIEHLSHDLVYQSGVIDPSTHWALSEHNPQNLSVDVAVGRGYFKKTAVTYHGYSDAVNTVTISANASGNNRIDAIVAYVDLSASPNSGGTNVLKFVAVAGTPASSPVAPDNTAILASIGAGNPYILLGTVAVANGASTIINSNITDSRPSAYVKVPASIYDTLLLKPKVGGSYQQVQSQSGNGTITLDCANYNVFNITMTGAVTIAESNMQIGQFIQVDLIQDATGSRVPTWFGTISWEDGVTPTQTSGANKRDSYVIKKTGASAYIGYQIAQNI